MESAYEVDTSIRARLLEFKIFFLLISLESKEVAIRRRLHAIPLRIIALWCLQNLVHFVECDFFENSRFSRLSQCLKNWQGFFACLRSKLSCLYTHLVHELDEPLISHLFDWNVWAGIYAIRFDKTIRKYDIIGHTRSTLTTRLTKNAFIWYPRSSLMETSMMWVTSEAFFSKFVYFFLDTFIPFIFLLDNQHKQFSRWPKQYFGWNCG